MTDYISNPLSTLNADLNAAVTGVESLTGYATTDSLTAYATQNDLSSAIGDINTVLDSINGEVI